MMRDGLVHLFLYPLSMKPISWYKEVLNKGLEIHVKRIAYSFLVAIFKSLPCLTCSHKENSWQVTDPFT